MSNFLITKLGESTIPSPYFLSKINGDLIANYVHDDEFIIYDVHALPNMTVTYEKKNLLEKAGPREQIYFDPKKVHAGIVTCGGLCPGINSVIRSIIMTLWYQYGVRRISGFRYGYRGLFPENNYPVMELNPENVVNIHHAGGTILGSSRGGGDRVKDIVDTLVKKNVNVLFTIGGDGTQKGALVIAEEIQRRSLDIAVVGIPKTIDNDLSYVHKSFGFETAVSKAVEAVSGAHVEANDSQNGIGLVKLMGRESGFISAYTALANNEVNFVLVPEIPFELDGENGLLVHLKKRLLVRKHAVIVVSEGAGQDLLPQTDQYDASGNKKLADIGSFLKGKIAEYFRKEQMEINLKYIDPSYIIRSVAANPADSVYCTRLGSNAVHAAMTGRTKMLVSIINNNFVHVPFELVVEKRNRLNPESSLWRDVVQATGQPALMKNKR